MQTKHLFLLTALAFLACAGLQAQVRIGDNTAPTAGALLDLNSTAKGGLVLSNVSLADLRTIPTEIYDAVTINTDPTKKADLKGAIVYNTNPDTGMGIYVWTGTQWIPAGTSILYDAEGNDYTIGNFGDAGTWMTQNLRSTDVTYSSGGTSTQLVKKSTTTGSNTEPRYTYPRVIGNWGDISEEDRDSVFRAHEHYGLLYNWAAASGRIDNLSGTDANGIGDTEPATTYRGVCPENWHLPSDYEWSELEKEIATNPIQYSSQDAQYENLLSYNFFPSTWSDGYRPASGTNGNIVDNKYWGRQMKSTELVGTTTNTNGTSKSREKGGFDALVVGRVNGNGIAEHYALYALLWSSSSYDSSDGVYRNLGISQTGMFRGNTSKNSLYSVRCKKD
jgi:uncharacterized protein (TIGR02145 family)